MKKEEVLSNLHSNIKQLAKERGIQLGELESRVGLSPGYFSRAKRCGIEKVNEIAIILGTTMETLIDEPHTGNIRKLHDFFVKLTVETYSGKRWWYTSHDGYHCNFAPGSSIIIWEEKEGRFCVDIVVNEERSKLYRSEGNEGILYLDKAVSGMYESALNYTNGPQIAPHVKRLIDNFLGGAICATSGSETE